MIIDKSLYQGYVWSEKCGYGLDKIIPSIKEKRVPLYAKYIGKGFFLSILGRIIRKILEYFQNTYREKIEFHYDKEIDNIKPNYALIGYFQSYKYFDKYKNEIQSLFMKAPLGKTSKKWLTKLKKQKHSTALHYREYTSAETGGDYAVEIMGELDIEYYKKAISIIREKYPEATMNIFSNNIEQAKEVFKDIEDVLYVTYAPQYNGEDMMLMARCKHNIIANSSYSWRAAYLNTNPDKIVIAPKSWGNILKGREGDNDLSPESWKQI